MNVFKPINFCVFLLCVFASCKKPSLKKSTVILEDQKISYHIIDPTKSKLEFFHSDKEGNKYRNIGGLQNWFFKQNTNLIFAINGGMFDKNLDPQGLYIENNKVISPIDTSRDGYGNFYLQPNGVFSLSKDGNPSITTTEKFDICLLYTSPSPRDATLSRMPSSA